MWLSHQADQPPRPPATTGSGALKEKKKKRWSNGLQETAFHGIILFVLKCSLLTLLCFKFTYPENSDISAA